MPNKRGVKIVGGGRYLENFIKPESYLLVSNEMTKLRAIFTHCFQLCILYNFQSKVYWVTWLNSLELGLKHTLVILGALFFLDFSNV